MVKKIYKYHLSAIYFLILGSILFTAGCSSSLNSERYKTKSENSKIEKKSPVRFTSEDNNNSKWVEDISEDELKSPALSEDIDSEDDDADDIPEEKNNLDLSSVSSKLLSSNIEANGFSTAKEKMLMEIIRYLNTPYKYGGNSKNGIDCSAFTQTVYGSAVDFPLLRTARDQFTQGSEVVDKDELKFGDLVFFNTRRRVRPGHVGIYIGDNLFAHASSRNGVIVSSLENDYYSKRFMGGRRLEDLSASR